MMDKVEGYRCAMLAVLRDATLKDDKILEVLEVLMDAQNIEKEAAAWANSQALEAAQDMEPKG